MAKRAAASLAAVNERAIAPIRNTADLVLRSAGHAVTEFIGSDNFTFAASIAYYSLLSVFPFLLLTVSVVRHISGSGKADRLLAALIGSAVPSHFEFLFSQLQVFSSTPLKLTVIGSVVAAWGATGVFNAICVAVNNAWGVEQSHGFVRQRLIAFAMLVAASLLAVAAFAIVSAAQMVDARWFLGALARAPELLEVRRYVLAIVPTPIFIVVVGLIYYFVPNAQVRIRDVWCGAIIAGVAWRAAFQVFAWFVSDQARFSIDGSIGAVVAFLLWVYVCAVILLYGVEVTAAYARLRKHLGRTEPAAATRT